MKVGSFKNLRAAAITFAALELIACSRMHADKSSTPSISSAGLTSANIPTSGPNVMKIQVGSCGSTITNFNTVCASVTICTPGTTICQTIPNLLVDTGSYGLRIFKSLVTVSLTPVTTSNGGALNTCVSYLDGSSDWGPVQMADVVLGTETAASVPMQLITGTNAPKNCTNPDSSPSQAGFNGVLGVGLYKQDCGAACVTDSTSGLYYSCVGTSCTGSTAALAQQVVNPVVLLPVDNNGVVMMLPMLPAGGYASSVTGALILGIGTQTNNTLGKAKLFSLDSSGNFISIFNGQSFRESFLDSGSNILLLPADTILKACTGTEVGFYCPANVTPLAATQEGADGSNVTQVQFSVAAVDTVVDTGAYNNIAGSSETSGSSNYLDFGLPFFYGRAIFVGIEGQASSIGVGPYWAY